MVLHKLSLCLFCVLTVSSWSCRPRHESSKRDFLPPTGAFGVARLQFDWVDDSRLETLGENDNLHREIVVFLWYPIIKRKCDLLPWLPKRWAQAYFAEQLTIKGLSTTSASDTFIPRSNSCDGGKWPQAQQKYPLLLFEPGYNQMPTSYSQLIEDVVSHGYIVAGIVPTYFAPSSVLSGDKVANRDNRIKHATRSTFESVLPIWTGDMRFVLARLRALNSEHGALENRIDFERVGSFGHSFGGAAAIQTAREDPVIRAAVDLDGDLFGSVTVEGLQKPLVIVRARAERNTQDSSEAVSQSAEGRQRAREYNFVFHSGHPGYCLTLIGATHMSFSDQAFLPFVDSSTKTKMGPIDPSRALSITEAYVEAFFDEYLKNIHSPLLAGPSASFPEVVYTKD